MTADRLRFARPAFICYLLVTGGLLFQPHQAFSAPDGRLTELVEAFYEESLRLYPMLATYNGDHRFDDRFEIAISPEHRTRAAALEQKYLDKLLAIDPATLDEADRITWDVFHEERVNGLESFKFPSHLIPLDAFSSPQASFVAMGAGGGIQPLETVEDYDRWLRRLSVLEPWIDQAIVNLREGIGRGVTHPQSIVQIVIGQTAGQIVDDVEASAYFGPVADPPEDFSEADAERLRAEFTTLIADHVVPAYRRLNTFLRDEYLEQSRETISLGALPDGEAWYASLVRTYVGGGFTPEEIHEIGLREVARIQGAIAQANAEAGGRSAPGYGSQDELLAAYNAIHERVDAGMSDLFNEYPESPFEIRFVDPARAQTAPPAFYMPGTADGSRPGVFFVNPGMVAMQNTGTAQSLFLHEAIPGHHYQISVQRELDSLPRFRRFGQFVAYIEGWGLYVESLGKDFGLYEAPEVYVGRLGSELMRAKRLVGDTGIHAKGWTAEEARESLGWLAYEIPRYTMIPGQALGYKLGELKILELRQRAEDALGERFDIKAFHTEVLGEGALPLSVLEAKIDRWIESNL